MINWTNTKSGLYTTKNGFFFNITTSPEEGTVLQVNHHIITISLKHADVQAAMDFVEQLTAKKSRITTIHGYGKGKKNIFFFSTDHCQHSRVPARFVPVTSYLPYLIKPRPGFETGIIDSKETLKAFLEHCGEREIPNPDPAYQPV